MFSLQTLAVPKQFLSFILFLLLAVTTPLVYAAVVIQVDTGENHTCAVLKGGAVYCWGENNSGQLGDMSTTNSNTPVLVNGVTDAVSVSAGYDYSCALRASGSVVCWGDNQRSAVKVGGLNNIVAVSSGGLHTCALSSSGSVFCWGDGRFGQLGNGRMGGGDVHPYNSSVPVAVVSLNNAVAISAGGTHTCALTSGGTVLCWGNGYNGQLGNGLSGHGNTDYASSVPVAAIGLNSIVAMSAGKSHTCALTSTTVFCWGRGRNGQLDGLTDIDSSAPVPTTSSNVAVSAGSYRTCFLKSVGTVGCRGYAGYSYSGDRYSKNWGGFNWISGLDNAVAISAGHLHVCALTASGNVVCWGDGAFGKLGNGSGSSSSTPVAVVGLTTPLPVSANVAVEFYHPQLDHYFMSAGNDEVAELQANSALGWLRTGNTFKVGGSTPVCRFYGSQSPGPNSHFYTGDPSECASLKMIQASTPDTQKRWNYEGLAFNSTPPIAGACKTGTVPVYRAYNNGTAHGVDSNHRLTTNPGAIDAVVAWGWKNEGVVMCAPI